MVQAASSGGGIRRHMCFGAVLTGPDGKSRVFADKLELRAMGLEHSRNDNCYVSVLPYQKSFGVRFVVD